MSSRRSERRHRIRDEEPEIYTVHRPDAEELRRARTEYYSRPTRSVTSRMRTCEASQSRTREKGKAKDLYSRRDEYEYVYKPARSEVAPTEYSGSSRSKRHHRIDTASTGSKHHKHREVNAFEYEPAIRSTKKKDRLIPREVLYEDIYDQDLVVQCSCPNHGHVYELSHRRCKPSTRQSSRDDTPGEAEFPGYAADAEPHWRGCSLSRQSVTPNHRSNKAQQPLEVETLDGEPTYTPQPALPQSQSSIPPSPVECLTCTTEVPQPEAAHLPCGHNMCHDCLKHVFQLSTTDPQLMPPRCCAAKPISLRHVENLFDDDFKMLWNEKYQEFGTENRLYCPKKECGRWIKPHRVLKDARTGRNQGACKHCGTHVCASCNLKWHGASKCASDKATQAFAKMAKKAGWKKCYNCKAMVELKEGCNHMTCICKAQFCYVCGDPWKTCECPQFSDRAMREFEDALPARQRQIFHDEAFARQLEFELAAFEELFRVMLLSRGRPPVLFQYPIRHGR